MSRATCIGEGRHGVHQPDSLVGHGLLCNLRVYEVVPCGCIVVGLCWGPSSYRRTCELGMTAFIGGCVSGIHSWTKATHSRLPAYYGWLSRISHAMLAPRLMAPGVRTTEETANGRCWTPPHADTVTTISHGQSPERQLAKLSEGRGLQARGLP